MGLEVVDILSEEAYSSEFTCAICCSLVSLPNTLITSPCSHPFCNLCLTTWLNKAQRCPQCNLDLSTGNGGEVGVSEMRVSQPLAYRLLKRIRVRCPISKHCMWKGDYGDLQDHLESNNVPAHQDGYGKQETKKKVSADKSLPDKSLPERFKEQGDSKFGGALYEDAEALYTKAIELVVNNEGSIAEQATSSTKLFTALYANRAACRLMLKKFRACVKDCDSCIRKDSSYVKAYLRKSKALSELGEFDEACASLEDVGSEADQNAKFAREVATCSHIRDEYNKGLRMMMKRDYGSAKIIFSSLLSMTTAPKVILSLARAELGVGSVDKALRLSLKVNRADDTNAEGYEVRGRAMLLGGDFERAKESLREAIRLDPDLENAKLALKICRTLSHLIKDAKNLIFERKFEEASRLFSAAVDCYEETNLPQGGPLIVDLWSQRAGALNKANKYEESLKDSARAIYYKGDCREAWLEKAKSLHGLRRYEEARDELEELMGTWGGGDEAIRSSYNKAVFECRKSNRVDYYELLGVGKVASEMEIKKQYKKRALELHPDKQDTEEDKKACEEKFKLLGECLEILCDQFKRDLYDEGYDKESIEERVQAANRAAHHQHHDGKGYHHNYYHK